MNNTVFGKTMGNTRKHSDWKLVITGARRNYLLSEPKYYITNFWCENLLAIEMKKHKYSWINSYIQVYQLPEISKIVTHEYWYDYIRPKCKKKQI